MALNNKKIKKYIALFGILFLFPLFYILFGRVPKHSFYTLPYYSKDTIVELKVNEGTKMDDFFTLPDFEFTNQYNDTYTLDSLKGKVWLATFYATNSPAIKNITKQLLWVNFNYRKENDIALVTFTLDPEYDTPEVLLEYGEQLIKYNESKQNWQFLTGDPKKLDDLIKNGFLFDDVENTTVMWLVDDQGHLRGRYHLDATHEVKSALEDVALLKKQIDFRKYKAKKENEK